MLSFLLRGTKKALPGVVQQLPLGLLSGRGGDYLSRDSFKLNAYSQAHARSAEPGINLASRSGKSLACTSLFVKILFYCLSQLVIMVKFMASVC